MVWLGVVIALLILYMAKFALYRDRIYLDFSQNAIEDCYISVKDHEIDQLFYAYKDSRLSISFQVFFDEMKFGEADRLKVDLYDEKGNRIAKGRTFCENLKSGEYVNKIFLDTNEVRAGEWYKISISLETGEQDSELYLKGSTTLTNGENEMSRAFVDGQRMEYNIGVILYD